MDNQPISLEHPIGESSKKRPQLSPSEENYFESKEKRFQPKERRQYLTERNHSIRVGEQYQAEIPDFPTNKS